MKQSTQDLLDRITADLKAVYPLTRPPDQVAGKPDLRMWYLCDDGIPFDLKELETWQRDGLSWAEIQCEIFDRIRAYSIGRVQEYLIHMKKSPTGIRHTSVTVDEAKEEPKEPMLMTVEEAIKEFPRECRAVCIELGLGWDGTKGEPIELRNSTMPSVLLCGAVMYWLLPRKLGQAVSKAESMRGLLEEVKAEIDYDEANAEKGQTDGPDGAV